MDHAVGHLFVFRTTRIRKADIRVIAVWLTFFLPPVRRSREMVMKCLGKLTSLRPAAPALEELQRGGKRGGK